MKKILLTLLTLSISSILLTYYYYSNQNTIPSQDISTVLSMLNDDTSGVAWLTQTAVNLNLLNDTDYVNQLDSSVQIKNSQVTITKGGNYILSGILPNGSIIVDTPDQVNLTLNNASITSLSGPAVNIEKAAQAYITLMTDTQNTLTDSTKAAVTNLSGTIYSNSPVIFQGNGSLEIISSNQNGVDALAPVTINQGAIKITAAKNGIYTKSKVDLRGGHLYLTAEIAGISAEDELVINDGGIDLTSARTALHSGMNFTMNGGTLNISNTANGIESSANILINDGNINTTVENSGLAAKKTLTINNGNIHVDSQRDALVATDITINDGTVLAFASPANEGLKCNPSALCIRGGTILAMGNHKILPNSQLSQQPSILLGSSPAHSVLNIKQNNTNILTFTSDKAYNTLLFSSPDLISNSLYTLSYGGSVNSSDSFYGLYTNADYTGGTTKHFTALNLLTDLTE